jgi:signal transduction histidine kinase/FixJ family two-component response regulator
MAKEKTFTQSVKGKIIIASVLACAALFLAWGTSKLAFEEMLTTVENISSPSERLRIVNSLSLKIISLDQLQKSQAFHNPGNHKIFLKESKQLARSIDTLRGLYQGDKAQLERIASMKNLLKERDRLFVNYIKVREGFLNSESFSEQIQSLNALVEENSRKTDSTIQKSEKRTLTTTIYNLEEKPKAAEPKGFFNKLFGKKKTEDSPSGMNIINEELDVSIDTVELAKQDSILKDLGQTMRSLEESQRIQSKQFLDREAILANTGDLLINKMLSILREVENDAVKQIEQTSISAKEVVNDGIKQISIIMLVFFFVTIILLYLILTDITKNNEYRKALEIAKDEAEYHGKAKQRFLANMSHEIRTPLQSIIGYAELIRKQQHPDKKDVEAIFYSSEHLMQIVNEILDYNRIISGKLTFSSEVFNMQKVLDEVISVMKLQATKKGVKLYTDFDIEEVEYVEGDAFRLKQILYNLIGNAVKFTSEGHVALAVSGKKQNDYWHFIFTIEDTGIGMSAEEIKYIFNEFEQVEGERKQAINQQGAGLGLSITRTLIESQGGRINVKSKKGEGSAFTVYLRFVEAEPVKVKSHEHAEAAALHHFHHKVWIVDDDRFILDLCSMILKERGIPHQCFISPAEVLKTDWDEEVKYILTDMRMPEMSGTELCLALKKYIPNDVKVIALTAQVLPEEREQVLASGFDGLLMKPFREEQLLALFENELLLAPDEHDFDRSMLEKMTFGDQERLSEIMKQFAGDSLNDREELMQALEVNDKDKTSLIVHRIAGRTAQVGAKDLAAEFRKMELSLHSSSGLSAAHQSEIRKLMEKLSDLIAVL